jgi:glycosyltransferase involved in cell wall biosynthesis
MPTLSKQVPILLYIDEHQDFGGLAVYAMELGAALRRDGYRVAAICHANETVRPMREALADSGVEVHVMTNFGRSMVGRLGRVFLLRNLLLEYEGAVLLPLMGYPYCGSIIQIAAKLANMRAVVRFDSQPPLHVRWQDVLPTHFKFWLADDVVVGSIEHLEQYTGGMRLPARKIKVIHTGINLPRFVPGADRESTRAAFGYAEDDLVIGTMSRMNEFRKGNTYFLEMAAELAREFPRARFMLIGDGLLRGELEELAAQLGIADRVAFTGWRDDRHALLASMDAFVMPSLKEAGPTALLEAMAMGLPVVSTKVGMAREVIEDGYDGFIVPLADTLALVRSVRPMLADAELRRTVAQRARHKAETSFSIDRMAQHYTELLANVLNRKSRGGSSRVGLVNAA